MQAGRPDVACREPPPPGQAQELCVCARAFPGAWQGGGGGGGGGATQVGCETRIRVTVSGNSEL